ncbi:MAG: hypothetical protein JWP15_2255 [Alphaproteobacteria bacterium]|nr:hypothetical protein [Alphaproteobacteria bacterium]
MFYVMTSREQLLQFFPKGGVGAEIGVAEGDFSAAILAAACPSELHLIDPWSHLEPGSERLDAAGFLGALHEARARGDGFEAPPHNQAGDEQHGRVLARFAGGEQVRVHRQYSYKAVAGFAEAMFDFVYLDGNHNYEVVLKDLQDFAVRLKPGGLLFGHDFFEDDFASREHYGVIEAVNTFLKRSDFRLLMLTWEPFSTFCLAISLDGFAGAFLTNLLDSEVPLIELPDGLASSYRDKAHPRRIGPPRRIPSFVSGG